MMRHLSVYQRFGLIIAVLTIVFAAALFAQVMVLRDTVFSERRTKVFDMVQAATKVLAAYDEKAKAGKLSPEDARRLAFDAIGAMRWGASDDYLGVYGAGSTNAGVTYVHANPKYINVNRWDFRDSTGRLLIQDIVGTARRDPKTQRRHAVAVRERSTRGGVRRAGGPGQPHRRPGA